MKKLYLLILSILLISCNNGIDKPRIGIAGIAIESSTFSPAKTTERDFNIRLSGEIFTSYSFFDQSYIDKADWFPTMRARALPGGVVTKESYESMVIQIIEMTKQTLPLDGLFFDIHGAMNVEGMEDPEGDFIERIRKVVGPKTLISTSMDSHGNVSEILAKNSDLITCYRMAPHEDAMESKQRALDNLIYRLKSGKGKPKYKAWIPVPILLPGEKTSTRVDPGKTLYSKVAPMTEKKGVIDAAIWVGYAWGDAPRNHAVVMTYGDNKKQVVESAEELAKDFWNFRHDFEFVAPTTDIDDAFNKAFNYLKVREDKRPFIISDMGDNPTAGGAGDVTWTLDKILNKDEFKRNDSPELIYASIPGPDLINNAFKVGVGNYVEGMVGAMVDDRYSPPLKIKGIVHSLKQGDRNAELEAVVKVNNIYVIVTYKRKPYHYISDFTNLDLDPSSSDLLVVKIGYLVPELYDIRGDWVMALTPGGVDQDLERLGYQNIKRPIYPLDKDMEDPDLSARLID
jgi:microcystin degradation protein MlrC